MKRQMIGLGGFALAVTLVAGLATAYDSAWAQEKPDKPGKAEKTERERRTEVHARAAAPLVHVYTGDFQGEGSYLGVEIRDVDEKAAKRLSLPGEYGVVVEDVLEDSPAAEAGLEDDDVIVRWNGTRVESVVQLRRLVRETPGGRSVSLGVVRDGSERQIHVELGERPEGVAWATGGEGRWAPRVRIEGLRGGMERLRERLHRMGDRAGAGGFRLFSFGRGRMGVSLQNLNSQLADYFGLDDDRGALITWVAEDSPAQKAGLKAGDVILSIGGEEVEDPGDVARLIRRRDAGPVEVRVMRDRSEQSFTVELKKRRDDSDALFPSPGPGGVRVEEFHVPLRRLEVRALELPEIQVPLPDLSVAVPPVPPLPPLRTVEVSAGPETDLD
ncbi:MAG: PDZ domain-containing protein [Gemmatimonadota bacterium]